MSDVLENIKKGTDKWINASEAEKQFQKKITLEHKHIW
jgi:hypothetical protein